MGTVMHQLRRRKQVLQAPSPLQKLLLQAKVLLPDLHPAFDLHHHSDLFQDLRSTETPTAFMEVSYLSSQRRMRRPTHPPLLQLTLP